MARPPQQAQAILNAQAPRAARLKAADDVITNEADMSAVQQPGRGPARPLPGAGRPAAQLSVAAAGDTQLAASRLRAAHASSTIRR